ncbi:hypothetical protein ACTXT7_017066, partial [Hymenolepis weldensis]
MHECIERYHVKLSKPTSHDHSDGSHFRQGLEILSAKKRLKPNESLLDCLLRELDEEPPCDIPSKVEENLSLYIPGTHRGMCVYFEENMSTKIRFRPKTRSEVQ